MIDDLPIFAICGWTGSGKTTLIEKVLPLFCKKGLKVAVVKHDVHGIDADRPGKDSDRFFQVGADVLLQGPGEAFFRTHRETDSDDLFLTLQLLAAKYDLILLEGHKGTPLRKVWLLSEGETSPPPEVSNVVTAMPRDSDRLGTIVPILEKFLVDQWLKTPVFGCVLIGGNSARMGTPKHLLSSDGRTWLERTGELLQQSCERIVIAGTGALPDGLSNYERLDDVPDTKGPMGGLLAAMRWAPQASWLVTACDLPDLSNEALKWLLSTRAPGVWATLPRLENACGVEPLLSHYDFRSQLLLEQQASSGNFKLSDIASHPKVASPSVPPPLAPAWKNVNARADL